MLCNECCHCLSLCPAGAIEYDGLKAVPLEKCAFSSLDFEQLVYSRRSIRRYKAKPVDPALIEKIVSLIQYSPTGSNMQNVHITVVTNPEQLELIVRSVTAAFTKMTKYLKPSTKPVFDALLGKSLTAKMQHIKKNVLPRLQSGEPLITLGAPAAMIFHTDKESHTPAEDCLLAAGIAVLHAQSMGLGTCFNGYITYGLKKDGDAKQRLGIPKADRIYAAFVLGYPDIEYLGIPKRKPLKVNYIQ
jgi:nitroreductase